jgi:hypothetical protein
LEFLVVKVKSGLWRINTWARLLYLFLRLPK